MHIPKTISWYLIKSFSKALAFLSPEEIVNLGHLAAKDKHNTGVQRLANFCRSFDRSFHGIENRIVCNGESWLLENTGKLGFQTIFDVGANIGNWSKIAYAHHPKATIHAFEIVPTTFKIIHNNLAEQQDRVKLNDVGLSNEAGSIDVFVDKDSDVLSTILDFDNTNAQSVSCRVITGAEYAEKHAIDTIDFLKIDVEGAESLVLQGFKSLLQAKKIRLIQFEYNQGAIISGFLLRNFYQLLTEHGYVLGKLFPNGVLFEAYSQEKEDFQGPNYVAVQQDDQALIDAIKIQ